MSESSGGRAVGLVLVSHSRLLAEGLAQLVSQVAGPDVPIATSAGAVDGSLGTDGADVLAVLRAVAVRSRAVVLMDLGSSVLSVRAALEELDDAQRAQLIVVDAPFVEGAVAAGVMASTGARLDEVVTAAREARNAAKL